MRTLLHFEPVWLRLVTACAVGVLLLPVWAGVSAGLGRLDGVTTDGPVRGDTAHAAKPVQQFFACLWMMLGIGGVLLAFASGVLAPVVAVMIAGAALEVCS